MVDLAKHHAKHTPGQTASHQPEQLLSAHGVFELVHASSQETTVKHSGILPASWYLEISQGGSIYTKEIGQCYKPGLCSGRWGEASVPAYHCF